MYSGNIKTYNIAFFGTTGYGKTSLCNVLFGLDNKTDSLLPCTKTLVSHTLMQNFKKDYEAITIIDTPGIGEFSSNDKYFRYYEQAAWNADCVVLVLHHGNRAIAPEQRLFHTLNHILAERERKYIIAINHIDSDGVRAYGNRGNMWDNQKNGPSVICEQNINQRKLIIAEDFRNVISGDFSIIPVSALRRYNIDLLKHVILK